jgi:hypothetical protein
MRILFIAALAQPTTGQSVASKALFAHLAQKHDLEVVNISNPDLRSGQLAIANAWRAIGTLCRVALVQGRTDVVYLTISESGGPLAALFLSNPVRGNGHDTLPDASRILTPEERARVVLQFAGSFARYKLFAETHQTLSQMGPCMTAARGEWGRRAAYHLPRTLPIALASITVGNATPSHRIAPRQRCVTMECPNGSLSCSRLAQISKRSSIPRTKLSSLSTALRSSLGYTDHDILCIYTGRLTRAKNPLVLVRVIATLSERDPRYMGLFIGAGEQREEIVLQHSGAALHDAPAPRRALSRGRHRCVASGGVDVDDRRGVEQTADRCLGANGRARASCRRRTRLTRE